MMTIEFWKSATENAIRAAAAAAIGVLGTDQLISAIGVNWAEIGGIALMAGIVSILASVAIPAPETRAAKRALQAEESKRATEAAQAAAKLKAKQDAVKKAAAKKPVSRTNRTTRKR